MSSSENAMADARAEAMAKLSGRDGSIPTTSKPEELEEFQASIKKR